MEKTKKMSAAGIRFSRTELIHLGVSWIGIAAAFSIALGISPLFAMLTAGLGFLLHELSHKAVAQHYKCFAEFRADFKMLALSILISFLGVIFAAPGAVVIFGIVKKEEYGKIAAAGPLANLILSIISLLLYFITPFKAIASAGFMINSWLFLFNMLPISSFDGRKILSWSKSAFAAMLVSAVILAGIIPLLFPALSAFA